MSHYGLLVEEGPLETRHLPSVPESCTRPHKLALLLVDDSLIAPPQDKHPRPLIDLLLTCGSGQATVLIVAQGQAASN